MLLGFIRGANHGGCALTGSSLMKIKPQILVALSSLFILAAANGQTQLKFWLPSSLGVPEKAAYQAAADAFSKQNPSIKATVEAMPGSETDVAKLMTAVRSGAGPDLAVKRSITLQCQGPAKSLFAETPVTSYTAFCLSVLGLSGFSFSWSIPCSPISISG